MADEININPDPAPTRPVDVDVLPDPPPSSTVDVSVNPDPPPDGTFDVPTTPDVGPRAPFDVPVSPDPAPANPIPVGTNPDPAPAVPFNVMTSADPGPAVPFDVAVSSDSAPATPFTVPNLIDPPPAVPFDVATPHDGPVAVPVAPPITLDPPPHGLIDVTVTADPPPANPFPVPIIPDLATFGPGGRRGGTPTIQEIITAVEKFDSALGGFLDGLVEFDPITTSGPGGGALDPLALARWFLDYQQSVGNLGVSQFVEEQGILYAMNPYQGSRIFDPSYFVKMSLPFSMGQVRTTIGDEFGGTEDKVVLAKDVLLQREVHVTQVRRPIAGRPDVFGPENTYTDGQDFTVNEMVDAAVDGTGHPYLTKDTTGLARFDASKYFESRDSFGAVNAKATVKSRAASGLETVQSRDGRLAASNFINGVVRVGVDGEQADGSVLTPTPNPSANPFRGDSSGVDDDDARVPLSFTDLRKDPAKNAYRSVYFRPLNLTFSQAFSPQYAQIDAFGRVDPVVGYQQTNRTLNVSWEMRAFAPEDVQLMYNKLYWLQSMLYPSYGTDSIIRSGPVTRMRIGDAISTIDGGVAGVIKSMNVDYSEAQWELRRGMKVPTSFKVSIDYLVLHDGPVGTFNGQFGVFQLPGAGIAPDKNTNFSGGPTDSVAGDPGGPTRSIGGLSMFGEPRK